MTMWLKQSTAATVVLGPFVDDSDFKTEETALTISQADIRLSKNGGAFAQTNNATGASHLENGYYGVPLDTTDTNTLGRLDVNVDESGALKVWASFMVVPANVWDSMFGADMLQVDAREWLGGTIATPTVTGVPEVDATHWNGTAVTTPPAVNATQISGDSTAADNLEALLDGTGGVTLVASAITLTTPITANATQLSGDATAADNAESFFDGTGYAGTNNVIPSVTTVTGNVNGNVGGNVTGAVGSVTGNVGGNVTGSVGSLATQAKADVNTEVVDALATDTYAEPSAVLAATASLKDKIGWLAALSRNRVTQTATTQTLRNDANSGNIATAAVSDDGTTAERSEWA